MWWFILGFGVGAGVAVEIGARWMLRKLKELDGVTVPEPADRTVFDEAQYWDWPL